MAGRNSSSVLVNEGGHGLSVERGRKKIFPHHFAGCGQRSEALTESCDPLLDKGLLQFAEEHEVFVAAGHQVGGGFPPDSDIIGEKVPQSRERRVPTGCSDDHRERATSRKVFDSATQLLEEARRGRDSFAPKNKKKKSSRLATRPMVSTMCGHRFSSATNARPPPSVRRPSGVGMVRRYTEKPFSRLVGVGVHGFWFLRHLSDKRQASSGWLCSIICLLGSSVAFRLRGGGGSKISCTGNTRQTALAANEVFPKSAHPVF